MLSHTFPLVSRSVVALSHRSLFLVAAAALFTACGETTTETIDPASQKVLDVLAGDWIVYSSYDETPNQARSHHFWTFTVNGAEFVMSEACARPHSYGRVHEGKIYFYEMPVDQMLGEAPVGAPFMREYPYEVVDDTIAIPEQQDGKKVGRTFYARPVGTLGCEESPTGERRVATQAVILRSMSATEPSAVKKNTFAVASGHQDLIDHLKASTGLLAPQGDPDHTGTFQRDGTSPKISNPTSQPGTKTTCTETEMTEKDIRDTFTLFDTQQNIYPGALIQGENYMKNNLFTQITSGTQSDPLARKRAPITVQVTGPILKGRLSATVADPSKSANVAQAVRDLIAQGVESGEVNMDYASTLASSEQQVNLSLGSSGRFGGFKLSSEFNKGITEEANHLVIYFFQKFYSVTVAPLGGALNAFDAMATDPADEITGKQQFGDGNPPLYVSQVDYGKQIFFEVSSTFSSELIVTAMNLAHDGKDSSAGVNGSFKASDVLKNASVRYKVRGGSDKDIAEWAVFPGTTGDGAGVFNALQSFFKNLKAERFAANTPAVPIGFSLNYLVNDIPASMLYSADFTQKSCTTTAAPVYYSYTYAILGYKDVQGLDDYMSVSVDKDEIRTYDSPNGKGTWKKQTDLDKPLQDKEPHVVTFKIYNKGGWGTGGTLQLFKENNKIYQAQMKGGTGGWTGKVFEVRFNLKNDGTCNKTYVDRVGAGYNIEYHEDRSLSCN